MSNTISQLEFRNALQRIGLANERVVVITSDISAFGELECGASNEEFQLEAYLQCIREVMSGEPTLVVPTFTYVRSGSDSPYIHESSPSETGVLTEHLRTRPDSIRSVHPVFSFAAIGPGKGRICANVSPHSYGWNSPAHRLVKEDAFVLCLGRSPHRGSFFIHMAEIFAGVSYRYTKELSIPVWLDGEEITRSFYHFVKYAEADIEWDTNRLVERLEAQGLLRYEPIGRGGMWGYRAKDMFDTTMRLLMRNMYALLGHKPEHAPWNR